MKRTAAELRVLRKALDYLRHANPDVDPEYIYLLLNEIHHPGITATGYKGGAVTRGLRLLPEDDYTPDRIRALRHAYGLTQAELAELLGYSTKVRVSELERGVSRPSAAVIRLLQAFASGYRPDDWPAEDGPKTD